MARYLYYGNFVGDGLEGLLKDGGTGRRASVEKLFESVGGTLECYYFAFGAYDYIIIADVPDNVSAAAVSLKVGASKLVSNNTAVLMTPEEMDKAVRMSPTYQAPGIHLVAGV